MVVSEGGVRSRIPADAARPEQSAGPCVSVRERLHALADAELVGASLAGEDRAFRELVERYEARLFTYVYRMIGDRERGEDIVQDVFLRVHRNLRRFDRSKTFSAWVYVIAGNLAKNELRSRSRASLVFGQSLEYEDRGARPDHLYHQRCLRALVEGAVDQLREPYRQVFVLRELQGKSYDEIAELTDCNVGTVKSRLNRARRRFATLIEPGLR